MVIPLRGGLSTLALGPVVAAFFARTGIARIARRWRPSDACVLTFHGVRDGSDDDQLLDLDQHVHIALFKQVCAHLAANYTVLPLAEIVKARASGRSLPAQTVAITFDDGYASNHDLAFPVLKEHGLPATIFATAGYLDGRISLWFHRIEMAFARTQMVHLDTVIHGETLKFPLGSREERITALGAVTAQLKKLPTTDMLEGLAAIESTLGMSPAMGPQLPPALRPMSWDQAREMQAGGLIEFGGHTDTHPILARCTEAQQAEEIRASRERLADELGVQPQTFAYTNGKVGDFTATTQRLLKEEGFTAAFTMLESFLLPGDDPLMLPRYGCPSSCDFLEAVVSGSMARFLSLRKILGLVRAA
ncbi:MAG: polysaccharide deacetylase [Verrucomicrobiaceae bacterium]|nr:polysaccharide deacetylase [Verrucomicrobiaceae bacterium]